MSTFPPPTSAPAGWYPDPYTGGERYFDGRRWVGDPRPPPPHLEPAVDHPNLPLRAAIGALVVLIASLVTAKFVIDLVVDRDWPLLVYIAIATVVSYGPSIWWMFYVRRRWGGGRFAAVGWRFKWSDLGWGPLTWVAALILEAVVALLIVTLDIPFTSNIELDGPVASDRTYVITLLVTAVIAAPVVEEVVFRGIVLRGLLSSMPAVVAIGVQGVVFGAAHFDPVRGAGNIGLVAVLAAVGVVLGGAAFLFRRLGPVVIAHAILNGVALALVLSGVLDDVEPLEMVALLL